MGSKKRSGGAKQSEDRPRHRLRDVSFSEGVLEFQAMVAAGLSPARALRAGTSVAAELLQRDDLGVLAPGKQADIVAMPGDPLTDIAVTAEVDFVMRAGRIYRHGAVDIFH
jgi:imidazolonepropionase-like amidohydrolase